MHMMELELLHAVQWHASGHYAADCAMFRIVSNNWRALPKWLSEVATAVAIVKEYGTSGVFAAELRAPCRGVDVAKKAELRRADVDILGAVHRAPLASAGASTRHFGAILLLLYTISRLAARTTHTHTHTAHSIDVTAFTASTF
jgi:hypothetical protein